MNDPLKTGLQERLVRLLSDHPGWTVGFTDSLGSVLIEVHATDGRSQIQVVFQSEIKTKRGDDALATALDELENALTKDK